MLCFSSAKAQLRIECEELPLPLNVSCNHTLIINQTGVLDQSDEDIFWFITIDLGDDGLVDYALSSTIDTTIDTWQSDQNLSTQYDFPLSTQWLYVPPSESGSPIVDMNGDLVSVGEIEAEWLKVKIEYSASADGEEAACTSIHELVDISKPSPFCISIFTIELDQMLPNSDELVKEISASEFVASVGDNCTINSKIKRTFNNIPRLDSVTIQGIIIDDAIPYFFDANGFVDFDGDGVMLPAAQEGTWNRYYDGEIQRWQPLEKSSSMILSCTGDSYQDISVSYWDEAGNTEFCVVFCSLTIDRKPCALVNVFDEPERLDYEFEKISPNPAHSFVRLNWRMPNSALCEIEFLDTSGKVVYRSEQRYESGSIEQIIPIGSWADQEVYLVRLKVGHFEATQKLLLLH